MGTNCCTHLRSRTESNKSVSLFMDSITHENNTTARIDKVVNKVPSIEVHGSIFEVYKKQKASISNNELHHPDLNNITQKSPMLSPMLGCSTSFRIEPQYFRVERKGQLESRYKIDEIIGKGSFGEVKKIIDKHTGLYRALKIISKDNCEKTDSFNDEIEIIKKLVYFI